VLNSNIQVWDADGTVYELTPSLTGFPAKSIEDRNGNITIITTNYSDRGVTVTDDSGRSALTTSGFGGTDSITAGGPFQVNWVQNAPLNYALPSTVINALNIGECPAFSSVSNVFNGLIFSGVAMEIQSITLPNGQQYQFHYGGNPYGMLDEIDYPDGASVKYTWAVNSQPTDQTLENAINYGPDFNALIPFPGDGFPKIPFVVAQNGCVVRYARPMLATRTLSYSAGPVLTESYSYTTTFGPTDMDSVSNGASDWRSKTTTVTSTDNVRNLTTKTVYTYMPFPVSYNSNIFPTTGINGETADESSVQYYDWNGTLIHTTTKNWLSRHNGPNYLGCEVDTLADRVTSFGKWYQYSYTPDEPADIKEYDYGSISPAACQGANVPPVPSEYSRKTVYQYQHFPASTQVIYEVNPQLNVPYLSDKPSSMTVYGNGSRVKETDYSYDQSSLSGVSGLPSNTHDNYL
jgi:hypothetical protein